MNDTKNELRPFISGDVFASRDTPSAPEIGPAGNPGQATTEPVAGAGSLASDSGKPDGSTPSSVSKKKRGRKPKDRPACDSYPEKFTHRKLIYYSDPANRLVPECGVGIFWDGKGPKVAVMQFSQDKDGKLHWTSRMIRNKWTKKVMSHYDMVLIDASMMNSFAAGMTNAVSEWFGGQPGANKKMLEKEEYIKETIKKPDKINEFLKNNQVF